MSTARTYIASSFPSAKTVAKSLGVGKERTTRLIWLMDAIRLRGAAVPGKKRKAKVVKRRTKGRSRPR